MADLSYYKSLADYDKIKDYLELEPEDFELPVEIPEFQADFSKAIVVDNLPTVGHDKMEKLTQVILKIYIQFSDKLTEKDLHMPFNGATNLTYGFCFIKFSSKEEAERAMTVTQGFAISKTNAFKVSLYSDLDKYASYPDEYPGSEAPPFKPRPDVISWLTDPQCRDQFVIRHSLETEISWANLTGEEPTLVYAGEREKEGGKVWCESYVNWSPQGTFLATFHTAGIKLWGSHLFEPQSRFIHTGVELVDFSPCESYMITYRYDHSKPGANPEEAIVVWDIRGGNSLRAFPLKDPLGPKYPVVATLLEKKGEKYLERLARGRVDSFDSETGCFKIIEGSNAHVDVPADKVVAAQDPNRLKWSHDGKYLARLGIDSIQVYELPAMKLIDNKSIAAKEVVEFVWCPRSNMISYWAPASGNHPSLVNILQVPERTDICSRKIFDVMDGRMVWQNDGDYLCVYMTKVQGKKKSFVLMFFRVKDAGVPVEQLELSDTILSVTWEPSGDRFCVVHGEARSPTVSFYSMAGASAAATGAGAGAGGAVAAGGAAAGGSAGGKPAASYASLAGGASATAAAKGKKELALLFTLKEVQCNDVLWSPAGDVAALAYFTADACIFTLYDVENNTPLATRRHDRGNRLAWDPSGRVIASSTISVLKDRQVKGVADDGCIFYTFQGNVLCQLRKERLFQFQWRPRPRDLFTPEEKKKIIKNLRKYEKIFDKEDRQKRQELNQEALAARKKIAGEFYARVRANREANKSLKERRVLLRGGYDSDDERNYRVESTFEEVVVSKSEQIIQ